MLSILGFLVADAGLAQEPAVLRNASFEEGLGSGGLPKCWQGSNDRLRLLEEGVPHGAKSLAVARRGAVWQVVPAKAGLNYVLTVDAYTKLYEDKPNWRFRSGAYVALTFLPSGQKSRTEMIPPFGDSRTFVEYSVGATAPAGTEQVEARINTDRSDITVDRVRLVVHQDSFQHFQLKKLHIGTSIVRQGQATTRIVVPTSGAYDHFAADISAKIKELTGVDAPIVGDTEFDLCREQRLDENLIVLGNRSTNRVVSDLYDLYCCVIDLRYPGKSGSVVRSLHDPFADGHNVIFVGASDNAGMKKATAKFLAILDQAHKTGDLRESRKTDDGGRVPGVERSEPPARREPGGSPLVPRGSTPATQESTEERETEDTLEIGYLAEIELGSDVNIPKEMSFRDLQRMKPWDATNRTGGYGWTVITKCLAYYYLTGYKFYAKEFMRLAFPKDEQTIKDLAACGQDFKADRREPLVDVYHYRAHLPVVYWDLVEESPFFSDEDRTKVTRQFMKQVRTFRANEDYGCEVDKTRYPGAIINSRHHQWGAMTFYTLGRYLSKYYPDYEWKAVKRCAEYFFSALYMKEHVCNRGEGARLARHPTTLVSLFDYTLMSGNKHPVQMGSLADQTRTTEILLDWRPNAWVLYQAPTNLFHKMAYLLNNSRHVYARNLNTVETIAFRPGQSYWPDESRLEHEPFAIDKWESLRPTPYEFYFWELLWEEPLPHQDKMFRLASFRTTNDAKGDYLLFDGVYLGGVYHCFSLLEYVLNGDILFMGQRTHLNFMSSGMTAAKQPKYSLLERLETIGDSACIQATAPNYNFADWRRSVLHRRGQYALVTDRLTSLQDSAFSTAEINWQLAAGTYPASTSPGIVLLRAERTTGPAEYVLGFSDKLKTTVRDMGTSIGSTASGGTVSAAWTGSLAEGEEKLFFSLVTPKVDTHDAKAGNCIRLAPNAAVLALKTGCAVAVAGRYEGIEADIAIVAADHLTAYGAIRCGPLCSSDRPIDVDWDFATGNLAIHCSETTAVTLALQSPTVRLADGKTLELEKHGDGFRLSLNEARHLFTKAMPRAALVEAHTRKCADLFAGARDERTKAPVIEPEQVVVSAPSLPTVWRATCGDFPYEMKVFEHDGNTFIAVATDKAILLFNPDGKPLRRLATDAPVKVVHYWPEAELLAGGCHDFRVIAFDVDTGDRKWVSESTEINPVLKKAGATGWFDRNPLENRGIHSLASGVFLDGQSQLFVGTASTLEALDRNGRLIKSMNAGPGVVTDVALVPYDTDEIMLLPVRRFGRFMIYRTNSRTPDQATAFSVGEFCPRRGASTYGSEYGNGYAEIDVVDLNGDGRQEVVGLFNGILNGIHVWGHKGQVLADAAFGDGRASPKPSYKKEIPDVNMRGLSIVDLDGDGQRELCVITSRGFLIALNNKCERLWSQRMPSEPICIEAFGATGGHAGCVVVGCREGGIYKLDATGTISAQVEVKGNPVKTRRLSEGEAVFVTDQGEVMAWRVR